MKQILDTLAEYFASASKDNRDKVLAHVAQLLSKFKEAGLLGQQFVKDFSASGEEQLHQRFSELYFGCWLLDQGFSVTAGDPGPDFRVGSGSSPIWIEVICPTSGKDKNTIPIPDYEDWGNGIKGAVYGAPQTETLLRWTSAIDTKSKAFATYIQKGIVASGDRCIVAVNACRLGNTGFEGVSQQPFLCEAVFAIGPQQVTINLETNEASPAELTYKPAVQNLNKSSISTDIFLNSKASHISAVIATSQRVEGCIPLVFKRPVIAAHNPFATAPLGNSQLAFANEYWVEISDSSYTLKRDQAPAAV